MRERGCVSIGKRNTFLVHQHGVCIFAWPLHDLYSNINTNNLCDGSKGERKRKRKRGEERRGEERRGEERRGERRGEERRGEERRGEERRGEERRGDETRGEENRREGEGGKVR